MRSSLEDPASEVRALGRGDAGAVARLISAAENGSPGADEAMETVAEMAAGRRAPVLGVTGTGGSGKSSLVDELVRRYLSGTADGRVAIISVDPSKRRTGGALLGDRIRVNAAASPRVYMRSLATRASTLGLSPHARQAVDICKAAGYDLIIIETPGIGQFGAEVVGHSDVALYVMTAEYGAASQLEKIDMLDYADVVAINKFDRPGALDALRDVRKQYRRNHRMWSVPDAALPVYGTVASRFNDAGVNRLYLALLDQLRRKTGASLPTERDPVDDDRAEHTPIPPSAPATWPRSWRRAATTTAASANRPRWPASCTSWTGRSGCCGAKWARETRPGPKWPSRELRARPLPAAMNRKRSRPSCPPPPVRTNPSPA